MSELAKKIISSFNFYDEGLQDAVDSVVNEAKRQLKAVFRKTDFTELKSCKLYIGSNIPYAKAGQLVDKLVIDGYFNSDQVDISPGSCGTHAYLTDITITIDMKDIK